MMGWIGAAAGTSFALALWLLAAFMITGRELFDRAAEWAFVAFGVLGGATAIATASALGVNAVLAAGLGGLGAVGSIGLGVAELAITLRLVEFRRVELPVSVAFGAILAWIVGVSALALGSDSLPHGLGWLGLGSLAAGALALAATARSRGAREDGRRSPVALLVALPCLLGLATWIAWLAISA